MTCWPRVVGNTLRDCGDKGISVGEDSAPLIFDTSIEGCAIGIEVKDRSRPLVLHSEVSGCELGLAANLKNWRYGEAGWPLLARSIVQRNQVDWLPEHGARLTLAGSLLGPLAGDELPDASDLEWLLREHGIRARSVRPGRAGAFELAEPLAPLFEQRFAGDFVDPSGGWRRGGGAARVAVREHDLVASFERRRGSLGRPVEWALEDQALAYTLVLELAGEAAAEVELAVTAAAGDVRTSLELDADPARYRLLAVPLPPRRYEGLILSATPTAERSRLRLHSWRVFAWPPAPAGGGGR
jgi:hypothetical protein